MTDAEAKGAAAAERPRPDEEGGAAADAAAGSRRLPASSPSDIDAGNKEEDANEEEGGSVVADDDDDDLAADTEEMIRFSSHLAQRYLDQQRQMSQPLLNDDDDDDIEGGGRSGTRARRMDGDAAAAAAGTRREGCLCQIVALVDLLLGMSLFIYGLIVPCAVLIRGAFLHRTTAVPMWAVSMSIVLGSVLFRSAGAALRRGRRRRRWAAPLIAALGEVALAAYAFVEWNAIAQYLVANREAMLLSHRFVREARDDPKIRVWFVAILSVLAATELCRSVALARESRLEAIHGRSLSEPREPPEGSYRPLGDEEEEGGDGGGNGDGDGDGDESSSWAAANARRWERWRDECDPGLRDRRGNYDPDAVRRAYGGGGGPASPGSREGGGGGGAGGAAMGLGEDPDSPFLGREESFEVRHGLLGGDRGRSSSRRRRDNNVSTSSLLSGLKFWSKSSSVALDPVDVHSVGEGSISSAGGGGGFAPVEGEVAEPPGVGGGGGGSGSVWPSELMSQLDG